MSHQVEENKLIITYITPFCQSGFGKQDKLTGVGARSVLTDKSRTITGIPFLILANSCFIRHRHFNFTSQRRLALPRRPRLCTKIRLNNMPYMNLISHPCCSFP